MQTRRAPRKRGLIFRATTLCGNPLQTLLARVGRAVLRPRERQSAVGQSCRFDVAALATRSEVPCVVALHNIASRESWHRRHHWSTSYPYKYSRFLCVVVLPWASNGSADVGSDSFSWMVRRLHPSNAAKTFRTSCAQIGGAPGPPNRRRWRVLASLECPQVVAMRPVTLKHEIVPSCFFFFS